MVYGDDEQVVRETFENIDDVQQKDGWIVLFRGSEAILRLQEAHVLGPACEAQPPAVRAAASASTRASVASRTAYSASSIAEYAKSTAKTA